jgi:hypothetical protein
MKDLFLYFRDVNPGKWRIDTGSPEGGCRVVFEKSDGEF